MSQIRTSVIVDLIDRVTSPIKRTKAALDDLGKLRGTIDQFESLRQRTNQTRTALDQAQQATRSLGGRLSAANARLHTVREQMAGVEKPTRAMREELAAATRETRDLARRVQDSKRPISGLMAQLDQEQSELAQLSAKLKRAGVDTSRLRDEQARLEQHSASLNRRMRLMDGARAFGSGLLAAGGVAFRFATGVAAVAGTVGYAFNRMVLSTGASFEKYQVQLEVLEGSSAKAKAAMDWVQDFATRTPFEIDGVMQSFVRLRAFGMEPMNGTMQAIADQTAKLGGGQVEMEGIVLALGQAWTKQKLQGEEALQLIERGVPVWDLLSKATGKSTAELMKMSEQGRLGRDAIKLLLEEMGRSSAGAAAKQMGTWNGMVSNLGDQWTNFKKMISDAGAFDALKSRMGAVLSTLDRLAQSGQMAAAAQQISYGVVTTLEVLEALGKAVVTIFGTAFDVVSAVAAPFIELGKVIVATFEKIGEGWNLIFEGIDKLGNIGIRDWIGKATASVLAGFGNDEAGTALEQNLQTSAETLPTGDAGRSGPRTEVGGTVRVVLDQDGRARVGDIQSNNRDVDFEVERGLMLAN